jgi:leucyl aminopeptidase (aminopeptidase T)
MDFDLWLNKLSDLLVTAGVPSEDGPMAALGLVFLSLTLLSLAIVVLLLKRNFRSGERPEAVVTEDATEEARVTDASDAAEDIAQVETQAETEEVSLEEVSQGPAELPAEDESASLFQRMRQGLAKSG